MTIAIGMICAGILPMPLVYLLRRFQILKVDLDIHQGSIRRNETTASTKEMIDQDDDVSANHQWWNINFHGTHKRNDASVQDTFHHDEWFSEKSRKKTFPLENYVSWRRF